MSRGRRRQNWEDLAMTKYRRSRDNGGGGVKDGSSFIPRDENDPFTELGKSRGKGLNLGQERREEVSPDAGRHAGGGAHEQSQGWGRGLSWSTD